MTENQRYLEGNGNNILKQVPLEGLGTDLQRFVKSLFYARTSYKNGDKTKWEELSGNKNAMEMTRRLRETSKGRLALNTVYFLAPIEDHKDSSVKESVFVVHGEVNIGEANSREK